MKRLPRMPPTYRLRSFWLMWSLTLVGVGLNGYYAWWNATSPDGMDVLLAINVLGLTMSLYNVRRAWRMTIEDWREWGEVRERYHRVLDAGDE